MLRIELIPTLDHCIESAARQEFRKAAEVFMQSNKEDKNLEERIELLRLFLETANFRQLRADSEKHLIEGKIVRFILTLKKGGAKYEMKCEVTNPT